MEYIVEEVVQSQPEATKYYELFNTEVIEDIDGNEVTVKKSIGKFNLTDLTNQKTRLQEQITELEAKIIAINSLSTE